MEFFPSMLCGSEKCHQSLHRPWRRVVNGWRFNFGWIIPLISHLSNVAWFTVNGRRPFSEQSLSDQTWPLFNCLVLLVCVSLELKTLHTTSSKWRQERLTWLTVNVGVKRLRQRYMYVQGEQTYTKKQEISPWSWKIQPIRWISCVQIDDWLM